MLHIANDKLPVLVTSFVHNSNRFAIFYDTSRWIFLVDVEFKKYI